MADGDPGETRWDFFVSYQQEDRQWAEWIAWKLEEAGHSVLIQAWDFVPGTNWVKRMQEGVSDSKRVIVVLSPAYIGSVFGAAEWLTIWAHDPDGAKRRVIPVRVVECERPGLLAGIVGIDLFGVPEPKALQRLQEAIDRALAGRAKPLNQPSFPGGATDPEATPYAGTESRPGSRAAVPAAGPPRFPGRDYIDARGARGVQIGSNNKQYNIG